MIAPSGATTPARPKRAALQAVTIYARTHPTRHVAEVCQRAQGGITNEFWFEGGSLRQSRQWVSPDAGYASFFRVID